MTDMMRGREPSQLSPMASAPVVAKPRARRRRTPVDPCPDGVTEASARRNHNVDVRANPYETIGLAKVGWYMRFGAHGGAGAVGLALSALTSSLCAN
jgi:hypothetical protein